MCSLYNVQCFQQQSLKLIRRPCAKRSAQKLNLHIRVVSKSEILNIGFVFEVTFSIIHQIRPKKMLFNIKLRNRSQLSAYLKKIKISLESRFYFELFNEWRVFRHKEARLLDFISTHIVQGEIPQNTTTTPVTRGRLHSARPHPHPQTLGFVLVVMCSEAFMCCFLLVNIFKLWNVMPKSLPFWNSKLLAAEDYEILSFKQYSLKTRSAGDLVHKLRAIFDTFKLDLHGNQLSLRTS